MVILAFLVKSIGASTLLLYEVTLAENVLTSKNTDIAKKPLREKNVMNKMERDRQRKPFTILSECHLISLVSSSILMKVLRALRHLNIQVATFTFPVVVWARLLIGRWSVDLNRSFEPLKRSIFKNWYKNATHDLLWS